MIEIIDTSGSDFELSIAHGSSSTSKDEAKEVFRLAKKEDMGIRGWRELVKGIFVVISVVLGVAAYIVLSLEEVRTFHDKFRLFVDSIDEVSRLQETKMFGSLHSVSDMVSIQAIDTNSSWPFVTVPFYELDVGHARTIMNADSIAFSPLVTKEQVESWESYVMESQQSNGEENVMDLRPESGRIYGLDDNGQRQYSPELGTGPYAPIWQISQASSAVLSNPINFDILMRPKLMQLYNAMVQARSTVLSTVLEAFFVYEEQPQQNQSQVEHHSIMFHPVFENPNDNSSRIVGILQVTFDWNRLMGLLCPPGSNLLLALRNSCGKEYTYKNVGDGVTFLGEGDIYDKRLSKYVGTVGLMGSDDFNVVVGEDSHCSYQVVVRPSLELYTSNRSSFPWVFTLCLVVAFFILNFTFFVYNKYVQKKNVEVVETAVRSNAIVTSIFPESFRDRLFETYEAAIDETHHSTPSIRGSISVSSRLKSFLSNGSSMLAGAEEDIHYADSKPIADLFLDATVLFADIVGFTAWSSVREPAQVFTLLETIYRTFDQVAKARRVFKVETVGDCYMAVTGLPDPRKDHAVVMARFACDCMHRMHDVSGELEVTLGPDTGELSMRFGMHSGPVTAGVLRSQRSRFQLFGDTVNTASRMESTGHKGRIHISQTTASLLEAAGKAHWLELRADRIVAKGKGEMTTYWLTLYEHGDGETSTSCSKNSRGSAETSGTHEEVGDASESKKSKSCAELDSSGKSTESSAKRKSAIDFANKSATPSGKKARLVDWNVEVLTRLLKNVVARRRALEYRTLASDKDLGCVEGCSDVRVKVGVSGSQTVLEEVREIILLPKFDSKAARNQEDPELVELESSVVKQLRDYVQAIASLYKDNPFHNFEHASHVTMSVVKLLSRIVAPADIDYNDSKMVHCSERKLKKKIASQMHDHTYGITSDPLTQFSVVFSALIHDAEHSGVPNVQLIEENTAIAKFYKNKSVAEQNSVDVCWALLMEERFAALRDTIFSNEDELVRFRQLVVNSVMATDIVDTELKQLRNARWDKAFTGSCEDEDATLSTNRKATIVIEHLLQASDVSHTMQHWHIFRKWNERLFKEMYAAYKSGRAKNDPSKNWYEGEIGFFDFYIIPLAKKLKDCGVFGVSSDEYLNYALKNREEWEKKGKTVVAEMVAEVTDDTGSEDTPRLSRQGSSRVLKRRGTIKSRGFDVDGSDNQKKISEDSSMRRSSSSIKSRGVPL